MICFEFSTIVNSHSIISCFSLRYIDSILSMYIFPLLLILVSHTVTNIQYIRRKFNLQKKKKKDDEEFCYRQDIL